MPAVEALDDVTPAQHEKKLQGAMNFSCTLAFISVAAVYALSTFGDQVPSLSLLARSLALSTLCNHPATLSVFGTRVPLGSHVPLA